MQRALRRFNLADDRPNPETSIERLIRQALDLAHIRYDDQAHIGRFRPDFLLLDYPAVIECDGPIHETPAQQVRDRRKDAAYAAANLRVYRFAHTEIRKSPAACVALVLSRETAACSIRV